MLCAVGDLVEDVVCHVEGPLRTGADVPARIGRHRGGSAANVAAVAARLTGRSRFVGSVGADDTGDRLIGALQALGVDCQDQRRDRTGTIVVLVGPDGERSFITDRGAAPSLGTIPESVLDDVTVLHLPGYGLSGGPLRTTLGALALTAHGRGIPVSVDTSSLSVAAASGTDGYREAIASLQPDVLLPNRAEAEQLGLVDRPLCPLTVVTAGAEPTLVIDGDDRFDVSVAEQTVVDSTGAGDAFAAAFLIAWVAGEPAATAVARGHDAAGRVTSGPGADWWAEAAEGPEF